MWNQLQLTQSTTLLFHSYKDAHKKSIDDSNVNAVVSVINKVMAFNKFTE